MVVIGGGFVKKLRKKNKERRKEMIASDIITLLSCDESINDIITINAYDNGIEILYTNEEVAYIEFSEEKRDV